MTMYSKKARPKWLWLGGGSVLAVAMGLVLWKRGGTLDIEYKTLRPVRGDIEVTILSTGIVQPENRLEIKPPIAGRVEDVLIKEGQTVRKGQILAWMSSTERAALLDAARAKGPEELARWQELYRATPILAPISGRIILRNVEPGQTFTGQDSVFVMSDRLTVKAQVDETDLAQVKLGQKARIVLDAYPREPIPGRVDQIAFEAKTVNNITTYTVDVLPERTPEFLRSGMTANVTFFVTSKTGILTVPTEAIKADEGRFHVLVRDPEAKDVGKPLERPVETGITDGKRTEIVSGLTEEDTLVVPQIKAKSGKNRGQSNPFSPMGGGPRPAQRR